MTARTRRAAEAQRFVGETWRIDLPCGPLLTANQRGHWTQRDRITRQLRGETKLLVRAAKVPALDRIRIVGWVIPPDRRRRDAENWFPSFKACIDGIVDAGVIPDDCGPPWGGLQMRLADVARCEWRRVHIALEIRED